MPDSSDRIAHVCMNVPDAAAATEWYTENFSFEKSWSWTGETERGELVNEYVEDDNGFMLQFREIRGRRAFELGDGWDHVAIEVDDLDEAFERVDHHGVVMDPQDNQDSQARIAFVEDPFGYVIELIAPFED